MPILIIAESGGFAVKERNAEYWIEELALLPHPEGGHYREVFRSDVVITRDALLERFTGSRSCITSIYYLLKRGEFSSLHRLKSDELWYFHDGAPLAVYAISEKGLMRHVLGLNPDAGEVPQIVIPAGAWFGALIEGEGDFSLVGCAVSPGFDFDDFEIAARDTMIAKFPSYRAIIEKLTR